jgi:translation initiation factor eIF-2B subunit gamma
MPHATLPSPGFQAFILCGPGASLDTFTSDPVDFPKAIVPIANRPMVWYPLEWCYRLGISDIYLVTPPEAKPALEAAMSQNPHLTSLPLPRPTIVCPENLTSTSGTGDIFRQPEVKQVVQEDFIVLPCDLISELDGAALVQEWMVQQAGFGGATGGIDKDTNQLQPLAVGGEKIGRRGAMGLWYDTKGEHAIKKEQTDFIMTVPAMKPVTPLPQSLLRHNISRLVTALPTDSLNDVVEAKKRLEIRHRLVREFGHVSMRTSVRDAHVYLFPFWALEFMQNDKFDSIGEDVLGWWAKASWQSGLAEKLGLGAILGAENDQSADDANGNFDDALEQMEGDEINVADYSSTIGLPNRNGKKRTVAMATRVKDSLKLTEDLHVPPILAYVHPSTQSGLIVKRVDTAASLLEMSLKIARLPATSTLEKGVQPSPLAHPRKIAHPDTIPRMTRIEADTCLLAENVTVGEKCNIKETIIGAGCSIGTGVRLTKCLLMEGVVIGDNVGLTGCILGKRCRLDGGPRQSDDKTELENCEVQGGFVVSWGTEAKGEKFMLFEGLDDTMKMDESDMDASDASAAAAS